MGARAIAYADVVGGRLGKRSKGKKPDGITRRAREADRLAEG
jgi:hypothetical protein